MSFPSLRTCFSNPALQQPDNAPRDDPQFIDDFLIFTLGSTLLSSANGQIKYGHLASFADLNLVGFYDWRSCALACLYNYLTRVTRLQSKSMCGFWGIFRVSFYPSHHSCWTFLFFLIIFFHTLHSLYQFWCYEYFPANLPTADSTLPNNPTFPRMTRWKGVQRYNSTTYIQLWLDEVTVDSVRNSFLFFFFCYNFFFLDMLGTVARLLNPSWSQSDSRRWM